MRTLYLIRHAAPQSPPGPRRCQSRSDPPLSEAGREQAVALGRWAAGRALTVYASPALRCRQTARALGGVPRLRQDLWEVAVGEWEGLTFEEIRRRWPDLYAARGAHMGTVAPPGGESFVQAGRRLEAALRDILRESRGEVAIVAHGGLFRGWLCGVLGRDPDTVLQLRQPWGGVTTVQVEDGRFAVAGLGLRPAPPGPRQCEALFDACQTPPPVRAHGQAVAALALRLAAGNAAVDCALLKVACLLHDCCRADGRDHPARAAALLEREGWPALAAVVAAHHDLPPAPTPEAELLYLADKLTAGTQTVSLEERFAAARKKCTTPSALAAWAGRRADAVRLYEKWEKEK